MRKREKRYPSVKEATEVEHIGMVKEIFGTITDRYDFLNHVLSFRRDVAWRHFAVRKMRFTQTNRYLDVACGTGDLALAVTSRKTGIEPVGIDFVKEMLVKARLKLKKKGSPVSLVMGDATELPFAGDSFDVACIAFGIRNIPERMNVLREMKRVVAPGGQVMILEMTLPPNRIIRKAHLFYLEKMLPNLARFFTANPSAYIYLTDSIKNFPAPDQFAATMEEAGLREVKKYALTLGTTWLFVGTKP